MSGQAGFAAALLDPARPVPEGLVAPGGRPAGKRFDVYRNNVVVSLTEALGVAFPVVKKLVGEANFRVLARAFLQDHPPRTPRLMLWGDELPAFLEGFAPVASLGYLPDVARLEQAIRESYHAAEAPPFDAGALAELDFEGLMALRLTLAPSVRLLASRWPVLSIWRYNTEAGAPKPMMAAEAVLVSRPGFDPAPALLPEGGVAFLSALGRGESLGAALETPGLPDPFDIDTTLGLVLNGAALTSPGDTR